MDNASTVPRRLEFAVLYASLKAVHLLAIVVWIGGMAFTLFCLRPGARVLEPAARVTLMHAVMARFILVVAIAAAVAFASGATMVGIAWSSAARAGLAFNMPLDWYAMFALFFVMLAVFAHIRVVLFRRLANAVQGAHWADGAAALGSIRWEVTLNLVLGTFIIVFVRLGGTA
jgi:uncharacterized membrane protein